MLSAREQARRKSETAENRPLAAQYQKGDDQTCGHQGHLVADRINHLDLSPIIPTSSTTLQIGRGQGLRPLGSILSVSFTRRGEVDWEAPRLSKLAADQGYLLAHKRLSR
jgi:hypothetical protein